MFRWIEYIIDRLLAVLCAIVFLQIPGFVAQYTQQLSGHVAELHFQVEQLQQSTSKSGKSADELAMKFLVSSDRDIVNQGSFIRELLVRERLLTLSLIDLQSASPLLRPLQLALHFDWMVAQETWGQFTFAIQLSLEGAIYGLIGIIVGLGIFAAIRKILYGLCIILSAPFRRRKKTEINKTG